jgi:hypothetical protein
VANYGRSSLAFQVRSISLPHGVDGDVVGLVAATEQVKQRALASIRVAALSAGFEVRDVNEEEFAEVLSD